METSNFGTGMPSQEEMASRNFWFQQHFYPKADFFMYSSWRILGEITPTDQVLDIGCGYNVYKLALGDRVYGIDPAVNPGQKYILPKNGSGEHEPHPSWNKEYSKELTRIDNHGSGIGPDEKISWDDYVPHKEFNVFLCLGVLQYGSEEYVESQVKKLADTCKSGNRVYWRQNPSSGDIYFDIKGPIDPTIKSNKELMKLTHFPWTFEKNYEWAKKYGFEIADIRQDTNNRIYSKWIKI